MVRVVINGQRIEPDQDGNVTIIGGVPASTEGPEQQVVTEIECKRCGAALSLRLVDGIYQVLLDGDWVDVGKQGDEWIPVTCHFCGGASAINLPNSPGVVVRDGITTGPIFNSAVAIGPNASVTIIKK